MSLNISEGSGLIVTTKTGLRGRTKQGDEEINEKIVVYLEDAEGKPVNDEKGEQKKLLCNPKDLTVIGFVD